MSSQNNDDDPDELQRHLQMEQEDGRSWIQLYDENASLRKVLRDVMESKNNNNNQQKEQEEGDDETTNKNIEELMTLRTQVLQFERFMKILAEENQELTRSLKTIDENCRQKYGIEITSSSSNENDAEVAIDGDEEHSNNNAENSSLHRRTVDSFLAKVSESCGKSKGISETATASKSYTELMTQVHETQLLLRKGIPQAWAKVQRQNRVKLDSETHSLQQIVADLSGRCHEAEQALLIQKDSFQKQSEETEKLNSEASFRIDEVYKEMEEKMQNIVQEKEGLESQRDQAKTAHQHAQQKLEALSFEMTHKMKQQERMSSLLQQQLQRSQKQLEQMTAEIQKSAISQQQQQQQQQQPKSVAAIINSSATPHSVIVAAPAMLQQAQTNYSDPNNNNSNNNNPDQVQQPFQQRSRGNSFNRVSSSSPNNNNNNAIPFPLPMNNNNSSSANSTPPTSSSGFFSLAGNSQDELETIDRLRRENIELINRLASTQEKVWLLETAKKSYEEEMDRLNQRVVKQSEVIRKNVGVKNFHAGSSHNHTHNHHHNFNNLPPPPTNLNTISSTNNNGNSNGGLFSSFFQRNRSNTTTTTPSTSTSAATSTVPITSSRSLRGAGSIPIEIVHSTHLQQALEDALSDGMRWKERAEMLEQRSTSSAYISSPLGSAGRGGGGLDGGGGELTANATTTTNSHAMALPPLLMSDDESVMSASDIMEH